MVTLHSMVACESAPIKRALTTTQSNVPSGVVMRAIPSMVMVRVPVPLYFGDACLWLINGHNMVRVNGGDQINDVALIAARKNKPLSVGWRLIHGVHVARLQNAPLA